MLKTATGYLLALVFSILLSPLAILLGIAIKLSGKGPVIFSQERMGRSGRTFTIYKFRSMIPEQEEGLSLLTGINDSRITPLGHFMRKHKFDEIPNFINVLKGEMSLIGPRPEQRHFVEQIIKRAPEYRRLQEVKPGITSWGQVKYGYATNVDEMIQRLEYDIHYLDNRSLWFDFRIAFHTLGIILSGKGI
ncbi:MAG TPA: sugar transferase [Bacteroidales bacterium]|nr:sugar transferase [Bacteroidales bacterium]